MLIAFTTNISMFDILISMFTVQVAILVIDCQGTGDVTYGSPELDNIILYIGLQLANVLIFNLEKSLVINDMTRLNVSNQPPVNGNSVCIM